MLNRRKFLIQSVACAAAGGGLIVTAPGTAWSADYPARPIKLVVPYPPGGPVDVVGRVLAQKLSTNLGQTVFVDNQAGANGGIGSAAVARAAADGYTLLMGSSGPLTINPSIYSKLPFNPATDFAAVSLAAQLPLVLVVRQGLNVNRLEDLVALAKAKPGGLTFGSAGNGSTQHLAGELFKSLAKVDTRHIPYKGAAPALSDVLAGRLDFMIELTPTALPHITAGKLRPLAVTTLQRIPTLANVPTMEEGGLRGFEVISWFGLLAPAGTPGSVVAKLNSAVIQVTRDSATREALAAKGVQPLESTPAAFQSRIQSDLAKWAKVVKDADVRMD